MNSLTKQSKQTKSSSLNKTLIMFMVGCAIGAACFLYTYGPLILNPFYDDWLFNSDMDLRQHYIGFCHYRMSPLRFPVGLIETLTYQMPVSIIYTDSIPLFAVIFKLFNNVLPTHFQYFGLFGLFSFCLQGGLSVLIVRKVLSNNKNAGEDFIRYNRRGRIITDEPFVRGRFLNDDEIMTDIFSVILSLCFVLSFTVLQRMFYHTALGAQWMILLAIYIWFNNDSLKNKALVYGLMGALCVFIHSYYLPLVGMILLASYVEEYLRQDSKDNQKKTVINGIKDILIYCVAALLSLFVLGGFYGNNSAYAEGLGTFTSNLNTFVNPIGYGSLLREMPLYNMFQYEGYAYLGVGMLIIIIVGLISYIVVRLHEKSVRSEAYGSEINKNEASSDSFRNHPKWIISICLIILSCMLSMFPIVTFNDRKIFGVPYPGLVRSILSIFRSNGRFIWVAMYLLMLGGIVLVYRYTRVVSGKNKAYLILTVAVILQLLDVNNVIVNKQAYFSNKQEYNNLFLSDKADKILKDKHFSKIIFLYNENDIVMDATFYTYLNNMSINSYYYARDLDKEINENVDYYNEQLNNGIVESDIIYVCKKEDVDKYSINKLNWYELGDHYIGIKAE